MPSIASCSRCKLLLISRSPNYRVTSNAYFKCLPTTRVHVAGAYWQVPLYVGFMRPRRHKETEASVGHMSGWLRLACILRLKKGFGYLTHLHSCYALTATDSLQIASHTPQRCRLVTSNVFKQRLTSEVEAVPRCWYSGMARQPTRDIQGVLLR